LIPTDDPRPRDRKDPDFQDLQWPVSHTWQCGDSVPPGPASFASVVESRRSQRSTIRSPLREIVNAIAYASRPRYIKDGDAIGRTRRLSPSAGALHPIDILIVHRRSGRVFRYVATRIVLERLHVMNPDQIARFIEDCREMVPESSADMLVFIGDVDRVAAVYDRPASLLWRDAGVLLQTLALTATAYRLGFCPLGIQGQPVVSALALPPRAVGVGAALMGRVLDETAEYVMTGEMD
jgi:hypothetical protein